MISKGLGWLWFSMVVATLTLNAYAQTAASGAITGVVVDAKGAPIANASIGASVTGNGAERTVFTDAAGNFTIAPLAVGTYELVVKAKGFLVSKYTDVAVRVTETTRLNPSLTEMAATRSTTSGRILRQKNP